MCAILLVLIQASPQDFGFQRSRWSAELLAYQFNETSKSHVAASTVRRWLPKTGVVWRRASPNQCIKDPEKAEKLAPIQQALDQCAPENTIFYEDEVDIDLTPKIGADWTLKGQQKKWSSQERTSHTISQVLRTPKQVKSFMALVPRKIPTYLSPCWRSSNGIIGGRKNHFGARQLCHLQESKNEYMAGGQLQICLVISARLLPLGQCDRKAIPCTA